MNKPIQPFNPVCPLCTEAGPCSFHSARSPEELGKAFFQALRRKGSAALVDFLAWALSNIEEAIPEIVLSKLGELDAQDVQEEFGELLEQDGFDTDDLRRMAALALACALINEQHEEPQDHAPIHAPQERRSNSAHPKRRR